MQSKATTVDQYLASLPPDRRAAIEAVRKVILANLDKKGFEEGMTYGMIGYYVPHRVYPAGYHCDPKQPLPYTNLGAQKNHMSLHMMGLYIGSTENGAVSPLVKWFQEAYAKSGKKLDMGKACIRFKKAEDLALDVIGEAIRRMTAAKYIENYEKALAAPRPARPGKEKTATSKASPAKPAATGAKKSAGAKSTVSKATVSKAPVSKAPGAKTITAKASAGKTTAAKSRPSRAS